MYVKSMKDTKEQMSSIGNSALRSRCVINAKGIFGRCGREKCQALAIHQRAGYYRSIPIAIITNSAECSPIKNHKSPYFVTSCLEMSYLEFFGLKLLTDRRVFIPVLHPNATLVLLSLGFFNMS